MSLRTHVSIFGVELYSKSSWVPSRVRELPPECDSAEASENRSLLALALQELCSCVLFGLASSSFKVTEGTGSTRMDHALDRLCAVEGLLFFKEECITRDWIAANLEGMAHRWEGLTEVANEEKRKLFSRHAKNVWWEKVNSFGNHAGNGQVPGDIGRIILCLRIVHSRDPSRNAGRTFIDLIERGGTLRDSWVHSQYICHGLCGA